jgi:hypothetical protein
MNSAITMTIAISGSEQLGVVLAFVMEFVEVKEKKIFEKMKEPMREMRGFNGIGLRVHHYLDLTLKEDYDHEKHRGHGKDGKLSRELCIRVLVKIPDSLKSARKQGSCSLQPIDNALQICVQAQSPLCLSIQIRKVRFRCHKCTPKEICPTRAAEESRKRKQCTFH